MSEPIAFVISSRQIFDIVCALSPSLSTNTYSDLHGKYVVVNYPWAGRYSIMEPKEMYNDFKTIGALPFVNIISLKDRKLIKKEK